MRILQVITLCELGGAQSVVINLANSLCREHDVIVAAGSGDGKMWPLLDKRIIQETVRHLRRELSPVNELKAIAELHQLYQRYKPDIIHLHSSKAGILGRIAFPKSKVIYTVHGFDSIRVAYRKFLPIEKFLQRRCRSIVGVSRYDEANLKKEGITRNVCMVYNGIPKLPTLDCDPFAQMQKYSKKILCIARLNPPKNIELFLETASLLPEYAFIWIGNQHDVDFKYPPNVFFMGNIPDAGSYIEYADLFFLPSNYEGLPIVILEALSFCRPVIASKVGGVPEILDGTNGFAIRNDPSEAAERIKYAMEDKTRYSEMCKYAEDTYLRNFTVDKMVNGYLSIYKTISDK